MVCPLRRFRRSSIRGDDHAAPAADRAAAAAVEHDDRRAPCDRGAGYLFERRAGGARVRSGGDGAAVRRAGRLPRGEQCDHRADAGDPPRRRSSRRDRCAGAGPRLHLRSDRAGGAVGRADPAAVRYRSRGLDDARRCRSGGVRPLWRSHRGGGALCHLRRGLGSGAVPRLSRARCGRGGGCRGLARHDRCGRAPVRHRRAVPRGVLDARHQGVRHRRGRAGP